MQKLYRQGDVLIARVDSIPTGLKPVPREHGRIVLAHGEVTGHAHAIADPSCEFLAADLAEVNGRFLQILSETGASVVHEEHDTILLPPGNYEVRRQREYRPEAPVWVAD